MTPITSVDDLKEARSRERAFVFLFVTWSTQAYVSERIVREVVEDWQRAFPDSPAPCYRVDVSEQQGAVWDAVAGWLTAEGRPVGPLMMGGAGPLLWVRNGSVVAHVVGALQKDAKTLIAVTRAIFDREATPTPNGRPVGPPVERPGPFWPDDELTHQWLEGIAEARRRADQERYPWEEPE